MQKYRLIMELSANLMEIVIKKKIKIQYFNFDRIIIPLNIHPTVCDTQISGDKLSPDISLESENRHLFEFRKSYTFDHTRS